MIRKHTSSDLDKIMEVWFEASTLAHPFLKESFVEQVKSDMRNLYIPGSDTWVYEDNGEILGFISMIDNEIGGLFVSPAHHSKGIGSKLVDLVGKDHEELEVEVFKENKIGNNFYAKYGFEAFKEEFHEQSERIVVRMKIRT